MNDSAPLAAVTASNPYPYDASLVAERAFDRDESSGMWVSASAETVELPSSVVDATFMRGYVACRTLNDTIVEYIECLGASLEI